MLLIDVVFFALFCFARAWLELEGFNHHCLGHVVTNQIDSDEVYIRVLWCNAQTAMAMRQQQAKEPFE